MKSPQLVLRPGVTNTRLWNPQRPSGSEWERIRKQVLQRDNYTCAFCGHRALKYMNIHHLEDTGSSDPKDLVPVCVACHAVLHTGLSMQNNAIEIWESKISQVEIVVQTRQGISKGKTLEEIKSELPLSLGSYPPDDIRYANDLLHSMSNKPRASLPEPLCAVFVKLERWQIE